MEDARVASAGSQQSAVGDDLVPKTLSEIFQAQQQSSLPIPMQNPSSLPLRELDPEVFERLITEIVAHHSRSVHFYGRRGQTQYGLDIVEDRVSERPTLYQVKRFQELTPDDIQKAVAEYAGPPRGSKSTSHPRRFDPKRFIIATAAEFDRDTKNVDKRSKLQREYRDDLEIDVWGAESISRILRDYPRTVFAIFGAEWARVWCGFEPTAGQQSNPSPYGFVESPEVILGLESLLADASDRRQSNPSEAARLYKHAADALRDGGFPGHSSRVRHCEAESLSAADDHASAFEVLWEMAMFGLRSNANISEWIGHRDFDGHRVTLWSESKGDRSRTAKVRLLEKLADWSEQGMDVLSSVPDLIVLQDCGDPGMVELCCMTVENALADGLFDFDPPASVVVRSTCEPNFATALADLLNIAKSVDPGDRVLRARLQCVIADAGLKLSSDIEEVDRAYEKLLDAAQTGRFLHARSLVAARAAFAYSIRGGYEKAEKWWNIAILNACEDEYYGDAKGFLVSLAQTRFDNSVIAVGINEIIKALPDRRQLISEGLFDPHKAALEYAHAGKLPDAFGDSRRYMRTCRISGHLQGYRSALELFGDILAAADRESPAVIAYINAGMRDKARGLAQKLDILEEVLLYLEVRDKRQLAAAASVIGVQATSYSDDRVEEIVARLLDGTRYFWKNLTIMGSCPELEAVKSICRFGRRLPGAAVDPILEIAQPVLDKNLRGGDSIVALLVELYYAVPERRRDIAAALGRMMEQNDPPDNLWDAIEAIPEEARAEIAPLVIQHADRGLRGAVAVLVEWKIPSVVVQVVARQACATLLRQSPAQAGSSEIRTTEQETVSFLLALLAHRPEELIEVREELLHPSLVNRVGGMIMATYVGDAAPSVGDSALEAHDLDATAVTGGKAGQFSEVMHSPDEQEIVAVALGDPISLAAAVAEKLMSIAEDSNEGGNVRCAVLVALRRLYRDLSPIQLLDFAQRMNTVSKNPRHSLVDRYVMQADHALSRMRMSVGEVRLSDRALVSSARAYAAAQRLESGAVTIESNGLLVRQIIASALAKLRESDPNERAAGAAAVLAIESVGEAPAGIGYSLLRDQDPGIRCAAIGIIELTTEIAWVLSRDVSAEVRACLAARAADLPGEIKSALENDTDPRVRRALPPV